MIRPTCQIGREGPTVALPCRSVTWDPDRRHAMVRRWGWTRSRVPGRHARISRDPSQFRRSRRVLSAGRSGAPRGLRRRGVGVRRHAGRGRRWRPERSRPDQRGRDSLEAERCEATIRIAIDAAADMHVPLVFLPSFRAGEIRDDADLHRTATVLASACDYVRGRPVTIATENTLGIDGNLELLRLAGRLISGSCSTPRIPRCGVTMWRR